MDASGHFPNASRRLARLEITCCIHSCLMILHRLHPDNGGGSCHHLGGKYEADDDLRIEFPLPLRYL